MAIPLVDLGSLMLRASRRPTVLPNMGLILRFPTEVTAAELEAEARRLASSPYGLGRRLTPARVPAARPRWVPAHDPPDVALAPRQPDARALATWLADELSVRHDPERAAGWRLAATRDPDGATVVALTMNHLFGTGRDIAATLYGGEQVQANGRAHGTRGAALPGRELLSEVLDSGGRLRRGAFGLLRLGREAALAPVRRDPHGELSQLGRPLHALRARDHSRGRPSGRRVGSIVRADAPAWAAAADRHGGTSTTLQIAVVANLLRAARRARGAPADRPLRLIVPVDLADRDAVPQAEATVGPIRLTSATVLLPDGAPRHGDLTPVRDELRRAIRLAVAEVEATGRVPVAPGVVDALRLLPDAVGSRVMFAVHAAYDGAASNVGPLPPGMLRIGEHVAQDAFLMAYPLGSDLAMAFSSHGETIAIGAVADPCRLAAGPPLRERLVAELRAWDVPATAW